MLFDADPVFSVTPDRCIMPVSRSVSIVEPYTDFSAKDLKEKSFTISGLNEGDIMLFGSAIDENGSTELGGFVVIKQPTKDEAHIVSYGLLVTNPEAFVSNELAYYLNFVQASELIQFNIAILTTYVKNRH
jgi:hypothetical protein